MNALNQAQKHGRKVWTGTPTKIVDGYTHRLQQTKRRIKKFQTYKGYHRLLVRFSAKCPNCVIFGMVVANDIENIFAKFQPPELI